MSGYGKNMSTCGKREISHGYLEFPVVRIVQYNFVHSFFTQWVNPKRNAPFWRFYWNQKPGAVIVFNDRKIKLTPDILVLIPPNTGYASDVEQPFSQFYMHFEWDWESPKKEPILLPVTGHQESWLARLDQWVLEDDISASLSLYSILLEVLREIYREPDENQPCPDQRIVQAVKLMNTMKKCSNHEIATALCMSRDNFVRLFSRTIGETPQHYMLGLRMEKSQSMLLQLDKTIDEIAMLNGFADRYQFSKKFKHYFGIPPAAYRKKHQITL